VKYFLIQFLTEVGAERGLLAYSISEIRFRPILFVGEAGALFLRSTPTKG